jgi:hypothetical protein
MLHERISRRSGTDWAHPSGRFVVCKLLLNRIEWTERTCVVKRRCVFSIILWVIIIVVVLLALGYFARGRRR